MSLFKRVLIKLGLIQPQWDIGKEEPTEERRRAGKAKDRWPAPGSHRDDPATDEAPAEEPDEASIPTEIPDAESADDEPAAEAPAEEPAAEEPAAEAPAEEPAAEEPAAEAPAEEPAAEAPAEEPAAEAPAEEPAPEEPAADNANDATPLAAADVAGHDVADAWLSRLATEVGALAEHAGVPEDRRGSYAKGQGDGDLEKRARSGRHWTPRLKTPLKSAKDGTPEAVARGLLSDAHATYGALVGALESGDGMDAAVADLGNLIAHIAGTNAAWRDKPSEPTRSDAVAAELRSALG